MKKLFVSTIFLLMWFVAAGQQHSASGVVFDAKSGKPLEFIAVYFKNTSSGCVTNYKGEFFVSDSSGADTLVVDAIGYRKEFMKLSTANTKGLVFKLSQENIRLSEAVVKPKRERYRKKGNPAIELIDKVIENKNLNRVETRPYYSCDLYEKMTLSLDDFTPKFKEKSKLKFLTSYIDTSDVTGKPTLTLSIRENKGIFYYRKSPEARKTVRRATRHIGLDKELDNNGGTTVTLEQLFTPVDIFENEIKFLVNRFVSPISSTLAKTYYKYYIMDTVNVSGTRCIDMAFVPYNPESYGFTGKLYITDDGKYSLKKIQLNFPAKSNINWIDKLQIDQEFTQIEDGMWALSKEDSYVNLSVFEGVQGIFAHNSRYYSNYVTDSTLLVSNNIYHTDGNIFTVPGSSAYDDAFWEKERLAPLNTRESNVAALKHDFDTKSSVTTWTRVLDAFVSEWVPTAESKAKSKFNFGPILSFVGSNYIEKFRIRIGGMTTARLSDRWFGSGYLAFGSGDKKMKGMVKLTHSFIPKNYHADERPLNNLSAQFSYDIFTPESIGEQHDIVTSLKAGTVKKLQYIMRANLKYEKQWTNSFSTGAWIEYARYAPATTDDPQTLVYQYADPSGNIINVPHLTTTEAALHLRWAPGERPLNAVSQKGNVDKDTPIFTLQHTVGIPRLFGGEHFYNRTDFTCFKRVRLSFAGFMDLKFTASKMWNQVPWPLLNHPATNQSFAYRKESFAMMNALEFLTDQYIQLNLSWHMKGMIFNQIPLIKKLNLRELMIFNVLYGHLSDKNNPLVTPGLFMLPYGTKPIGKIPYMELGVGIENILHLFRVVYYFRLNYRDNDLNWLSKWGGLRFGVYLDF